MCQTRIESHSVWILKRSVRYRQKKKHWMPWNGLQKNGVKNPTIRWGAGNRTGMRFPRYSSFSQRLERSYIPLTSLRAFESLNAPKGTFSPVIIMIHSYFQTFLHTLYKWNSLLSDWMANRRRSIFFRLVDAVYIYKIIDVFISIFDPGVLGHFTCGG